VDKFRGNSGQVCDLDGDCLFSLKLDGTDGGAISAADSSLLNGGTKDYSTTFASIA
jgi:hypothetical protein